MLKHGVIRKSVLVILMVAYCRASALTLVDMRSQIGHKVVNKKSTGKTTHAYRLKKQVKNFSSRLVAVRAHHQSHV
jgi:hypothetical protein